MTRVSTAIQIYWLRKSAHKSVGMMVAMRMTDPPIVGVPFLTSCRSGTSSRLPLLIFHSWNFFMALGVRKKLMTSAERIASTVLNVI